MGTYIQNINENMNELDILRLFSISEEFKLIPLREEEKKEIKSLSNKVPFPLKSGIEESCTKINILLQCYISNILGGGPESLTIIKNKICRNRTL